jgi:transcriptional regulator with XRE-family HTH domain
VNDVDGAMLREMRRRAGIGLRRVVSRAQVSVSDSHLSRVERGERPVTPAIVAAYEKALGVRIADAVAGGRWRPGRLDDARRQAFTSTVAMVAVGGPLGEPVDRLLEVGSAAPAPPARVGAADVAHVEQAAGLVRGLDLRFGGGLAWQVADRLLRWAVGLHAASMTEPVRGRLCAAIGTLAGQAGWAAFDADRHDAARALFTMALDSAVRADEADLRAHVLADMGAQYNYLGYPDDCLTVVRLAEDERVGSAVRCVLHGVKAYAYGAKGERGGCAREIDLAEAACAAVGPDAVPGWMGGFDPAHTQAVTGHAAAALAIGSGDDGDLANADKRLAHALDRLDATGRARAVARCQIRLAMLHLRGGDRTAAVGWLGRAIDAVTDLRSARVERELAAVRAGTVPGPDAAVSHELAGQLRAVATPPV